MRRRQFLYFIGGLASRNSQRAIASGFLGTKEQAATDEIIGMYIHQHWPYNHPYSARTWTVEDYRGYADGLTKLGYNTIMIWPILETMPSPLTLSDGANLEKLSKVIEVLQHEFKMRVWVVLCPNIMAKNKEAAKYTFTQRHFFYCDQRINPGDPAEVSKMINWREELLRRLAQVDAVTVIDSDPGGYPGSTNAEFVNLLGEHRKMLDRLRPGIELYYWMHAGWEAYCRYYETGEFKWGTAEEARDILTRLKTLNPEPWGITVNTLNALFQPPDRTHLAVAKKLGLASRAVGFSYGAIEGEPSFPITDFGGDKAFNAGRTKAPLGVVGNSQTHCVQLPNTFAFVRGATGQPVAPTDYFRLADDLIVGQGRHIVQGWQALAGKDAETMSTTAAKLEALARQRLTPGRLKGLLFGDPRRFIMDLVMELRLRAAYEDFVAASGSGGNVKQALTRFVSAAKVWQKQTGYQCAWQWPHLNEALKSLKSTAIDKVLDEKGRGKTPFDRVADELRRMETYTPRLIAALEEALASA